MSEFSVEGDELRKMLKLAKRGPLPFAYCPGQSAEADLFAIHRKKSGAMMGKALRAEGDGNKIAFGSLSLDGKTVVLQCDRELPALAKKAKKFLKFNKVMRNVRVLDASGNVIDEDVEDLPDDGWDDDVAEDAGEAAADTDAPADAARAVPDGDPGADLVARIRALQPRVAAVEGPAGEKLRKAVVEAAGQLKAGQQDRAAAMLDRIEEVLARADTAAAPPPPPPPPPEVAPQATSATQQKLQKAAAALLERVRGLPEGEARDRLGAQARDLVGAVRDGDVERAIRGLKALQGDLDATDGAAVDGPPVDDGVDPLAIWNRAKERSDTAIDLLQKALKGHAHPDLDRIADYGLNGLTEGNQVGLMKRLMEYRSAPAGARGDAAKLLVEQAREYRAFLATNEVIDLCERNPFVTVDIRGPLEAGLQEIEDALTR